MHVTLVVLESLISGSCPCEWTLFGDQCYYTDKNRTTSWAEAQEHCRHLGGHLAVPTNNESNQRLYEIIKERNYGSAWIGLYREGDNVNTFKSVLGGIADFTNWKIGEPNFRDNNENCAVIKYLGKWNDVRCSLYRPYVCQILAMKDDKH